MAKSVIQNDKYLFQCLETGEEFFIPCVDQKEMQSKLVSLVNARKRMSPDDQEKLRIQKVVLNGITGVKISPAVKDKVFKIINGKLVPVEESVAENSDKSRLIEIMRKDGLSEDEIQTLLKGEKDGN